MDFPIFVLRLKRKYFTPLDSESFGLQGGNLKGLSMIEVVVGVAVFALIIYGAYQGFLRMTEVVRVSRGKITAAALANEQFEIIRNLSYGDVGLQGGVPPGKFPPMQTLVRNGNSFRVVAAIRNIDDSFDGTIGGNPNDLSPADYKLAELEISCLTCINFQPLRFTTNVGPKSLESASVNGSLFVRVFDASGEPIQGANVHIENNLVNPPIIVDDTTNNDGMLQLIDAPPGIGAYEISVTKAGYSAVQTYEIGGVGNPNPVSPHVTVVLQQLTQTSFAIDKVSTMDVATMTEICNPVGNLGFSLTGSKLIGTNPDVIKYNQNHVTNGSGTKHIANLEWDTYQIALTGGVYVLRGLIPLLPLTLAANSTQQVNVVVALANPRNFMVTIKDAGTQLPVTGASIRLQGGAVDSTLITGRGFLRQTDWSGGAGQADFTDETRYFDSDGNVVVDNPAGEIKLREDSGHYVLDGWLVSSTFDTGSASNFYQMTWQPQAQPPETGPDSVKFQIATNNDKATWNFLGPDGTANTFYTLANTNIHEVNNGRRYLRYKVYLHTDNLDFSPDFAEFAFTFSSQCVPPGQVLFGGLGAGDYTVSVTKAGYQDANDAVTVSAPFQQKEIVISP